MAAPRFMDIPAVSPMWQKPALTPVRAINFYPLSSNYRHQVLNPEADINKRRYTRGAKLTQGFTPGQVRGMNEPEDIKIFVDIRS